MSELKSDVGDGVEAAIEWAKDATDSTGEWLEEQTDSFYDWLKRDDRSSREIASDIIIDASEAMEDTLNR